MFQDMKNQLSSPSKQESYRQVRTAFSYLFLYIDHIFCFVCLVFRIFALLVSFGSCKIMMDEVSTVVDSFFKFAILINGCIADNKHRKSYQMPTIRLIFWYEIEIFWEKDCYIQEFILVRHISLTFFLSPYDYFNKDVEWTKVFPEQIQTPRWGDGGWQLKVYRWHTTAAAGTCCSLQLCLWFA